MSKTALRIAMTVLVLFGLLILAGFGFVIYEVGRRLTSSVAGGGEPAVSQPAPHQPANRDDSPAIQAVPVPAGVEILALETTRDRLILHIRQGGGASAAGAIPDDARQQILIVDPARLSGDGAALLSRPEE